MAEKTCHVCNGTGVTNGDPARGECPRCDGAGKIPTDEE